MIPKSVPEWKWPIRKLRQETNFKAAKTPPSPQWFKKDHLELDEGFTFPARRAIEAKGASSASASKKLARSIAFQIGHHFRRRLPSTKMDD
jgi:hypothetical protein